MKAPRLGMVLAVVVGGTIGGGVGEYWYRTRAATPAAAQQAGTASLQSDVERLKSLVPTQSHSMTDVAYHWANLWFAAQHRNWPLARFFFREARQHVAWTVLIRPVRKGPEGEAVNIKGIWDGIEPSSFAAVDIALDQADVEQFSAAYKVALESCYSCHKAAGLPYLRPQVPTTPPATIINYDPDATWP